MPENSTRKLTIGILFLLTFAISVAAVYIGIKLSESPSVGPDTTEAADGDNPVCVTDDFEIGQELSPSTWIVKTSDDGTAAIANGVLTLTIPEDTGIDEIPRYTRAITFGSFAADFLVKVDLTSIAESSGGESENHIAKLAFPYFQESSTAGESYKVEAFLTTDDKTEETVIELVGYVGPSTGSVQLPLSVLGGTSGQLTISIEKESQLSGNELITINYNTGTVDQTIISQEATSNITEAGSFYLEVATNDDFDASASFDNFEIQCGGPVITIGPTVTSEPTIPQATATSTPGITVTPTIVVTSATLPTPTITLAPFISPVPTATPVVLPQTAIINDGIDRLFIAFLLIVAGFSVYAYAQRRYKSA